jgi:hypothetical protein
LQQKTTQLIFSDKQISTIAYPQAHCQLSGSRNVTLTKSRLSDQMAAVRFAHEQLKAVWSFDDGSGERFALERNGLGNRSL